MTIDRKLILDATTLKLATRRPRTTALQAWMDEAMSLLAVHEALQVPTFDGRSAKLTYDAGNRYLAKLGGGAKSQFCIRRSTDGNSVYFIRQAGPPAKAASPQLAGARR